MSQTIDPRVKKFQEAKKAAKELALKKKQLESLKKFADLPVGTEFLCLGKKYRKENELPVGCFNAIAVETGNKANFSADLIVETDITKEKKAAQS